jgi:hypothetical protein
VSAVSVVIGLGLVVVIAAGLVAVLTAGRDPGPQAAVSDQAREPDQAATDGEPCRAEPVATEAIGDGGAPADAPVDEPGTEPGSSTEAAPEGFVVCAEREVDATPVGGAGGDPRAYGDDERLDRLHDDCTDGDERACDLLYLNAGLGSDYEELAVDCAGRGPGPDGWCHEGVERGPDGFARSADDPGLAGLAGHCRAGDDTACDLLFVLAPSGSDPEWVGFTCGGRVPTGALPDCRTRSGQLGAGTGAGGPGRSGPGPDPRASVTP